ncbi:MAG TPA: hypothetical protein VK174_00365 [Chitinophagales bacterium]|nr:hypothetical protein [Chitinophagales bacterium]
MKRKQILRKIFSALFTAAVLFTVSVREVHYLFAHHDAHEHCENHLHSADEHKHCVACKFDAEVFTDVIEHTGLTIPTDYSCTSTNSYQSAVICTAVLANALRGPPAIA